MEITERDTLARRAGAGQAAPERTLLECAVSASLVLDDFGAGTVAHPRAPLPGSAGSKPDWRLAARGTLVIVDVVGRRDGLALGLDVVGEGVEKIER